MRIVVVTPWYPTAGSAHEGLFVAREAGALAETHEVEVIHLDWSRRAARRASHEEIQDGIPVTHVPLRRLDPRDYARARNAVRTAAARSDIVHTHALTGLLPWLFGRPAPAAWVHSEHWSALSAPSSVSLLTRTALWILRPLLRRPDIVIVESSRLESAVRRVRMGPIARVPCIVPTPAWTAPRPCDLRLVSVGGLIPRKGPHLAIRCIGELRDRGIRATLTWVGDGPLRRAIEDEIVAHDLSDAITLAGNLDAAGVASELDDASLFLLPTQGDNFCVAAAEALLHGRPIVSGAATGALDYAPANAARFVSTQTPSAYADAVIDLHEKTAGQSAAQIAAQVGDRFSPSTVRGNIEDVYRELS